jgi:exosortase/archaeosortase family protein
LNFALGTGLVAGAILMPASRDFLVFQVLLAWLGVFVIFFGKGAKIPSILLGIYGFVISFPLMIARFAEDAYSRTAIAPLVWSMTTLGYPFESQGQWVHFVSSTGQPISAAITTSCAGPATMAVFMAIFALMMLDIPLPPRKALGLFLFGAVGTWFQSVIRLIILMFVGYYRGEDAMWTTHFWSIYILFPLWYLFFVYIYFRQAGGRSGKIKNIKVPTWTETKDKIKKVAHIAAIFILLALFSTPFTALAAGGQSITRTIATSDRDSYVNEEAGKTTDNYGTAEVLYVTSLDTKDNRAFFHFDLSQIPEDSTVSSATLSLFLKGNPGTDRTHGAHRVTPNDWTEGDGTSGSGIDWATYDGLNAWGTSGGDFDGAVPTVSTGTTSEVWKYWTVTTDVAYFIANPTENYGWCIKDEAEDSATEYKFEYYSKETPTEKPTLEVTFTAPWDSYSNTARTTQEDTFSDGTNVVYMKGTGFLDGTQTYNVGYYDAIGTLIVTDNNIALVNVVAGRGDLGNTSSPYEPNYDCTYNKQAWGGPPDWHAVVPPYGATAFPSSYSTLDADHDTYELLADDTFLVSQTAIPEFPTVMAAVGVAGLCFGIYWWMRKRYRRQVARVRIFRE